MDTYKTLYQLQIHHCFIQKEDWITCAWQVFLTKTVNHVIYTKKIIMYIFIFMVIQLQYICNISRRKLVHCMSIIILDKINVLRQLFIIFTVNVN